MIILLNIFAIAFENYFIFKMLCNFKNIKDKKWELYFGLLIIYFISLFLTNPTTPSIDFDFKKCYNK